MSRSQPCLGVFTDDPRKIVRRLPRPKTPFVPAPAQPIGDFYPPGSGLGGLSASYSPPSADDPGCDSPGSPALDGSFF
jgi:hypothetical protein